jgi:hypothetical protein
VTKALRCSPRYFAREIRRMLRMIADRRATNVEWDAFLLWFIENPPPKTTGLRVSTPRSLRPWLGRWVQV